ncbi:hypothetical protein [Hyalangium minutum]|uniref:DUF4412 domain-containing protein n=1 Tax=Hyalangium minutum TaxID=394096 RepID=A0A085WHZ3_9BACT|nr:hypothetical protein [Hyalangium minutum]KFE67306.1 hypothetical protein DB31_8659 [Hyalangium minutum]KFE67393.1 hypothetical protein DB31_8746 [Hyalangium minutum]
MRFVVLLAAMLFTASSALAADPTAAAPKAEALAAGPELRFAWGAPSRVTVTERILKKGRRSVVRYDAALSARQGGGYELKLDKFQFVELDGRDVTKGPLPLDIKAAAAVAGAIPTLVLSPEGQVVDVVGMEETVARALAMIPEEKGMREQMRAALSQPSMAQMMKQKAGDFWNVWVGAWVGTDLAAGAERSGTVPMQLPSGPVDSQVTVRHRGPEAGRKGAVRLEMETVLEGEPFRKGMAGVMAQMMKAAGPADKTPDFNAMLKSARRVSTLEVVTDAATLRPYSARTSQVTKLQVEGQEREEVEEREYSFAWSTQKASKRR